MLNSNSNNNGSSSTRNRSPFTPTQWQELEHQALIYKYMVSGVPIPTELIFSVKRSLESSLASRINIFPHQSIGWGCFQVGFGRKTDPEPGRCRRTDGKKWRCSKEAYPDSKYCERHMHRGRNRSRKPVELITNSTPTATTATSNNSSNLNPSPSSSSINRNQQLSSSSPSPSASPYSFSPLSSSSPVDSDLFQNPSSHNTIRTAAPFPCSHSSTSSRPPPASGSASASTHNLFLDSASSAHLDRDYRYFNGMREGSDERAFFPESSGNIRSLQDSYHNIPMAGSYKSFSQTQFDALAAEATNSKQQQDNDHDHQQQQQHCFVLGTDFKSSSTTARQIKLEKESADQTQKSLHHFFGEWPPKNSESWLDLASSTSRLQTDG